MTDRRYCIIGAGYVGNGVARAFKSAGIAYDQLEATDHIGGNWAHGVYESTHLISSRDGSGYTGFPMPSDYPDFPSRAQMLAYLESFVDHYQLRENIQFNTEVVHCEPLDTDGMAGWRVELASGEAREYAGVVVVNGHDWKVRLPEYPGEFTGRQLHSKQYFSQDDLDGDHILVVGAGNSACDIAVETAMRQGTCDISMRSGAWFVPKMLLGMPLAEWDKFWVPLALQRLVMGLLIRFRFGSWKRYGLPAPAYRLFDKEPVVNEQMLYYLRHGRVKARPGIERLNGSTVHFTDGTSGDYDTIVWATGFEVGFPFLDETLFRWQDGNPVLINYLLAPGLANLYLFGLLKPRGGSGELISHGSDLVARIVAAQEHLDTPISAVADRTFPHTTSMLVGITQMTRVFASVHTFLDILERTAKLPAPARAAAAGIGRVAPKTALRAGLGSMATTRHAARILRNAAAARRSRISA